MPVLPIKPEQRSPEHGTGRIQTFIQSAVFYRCDDCLFRSRCISYGYACSRNYSYHNRRIYFGHIVHYDQIFPFILITKQKTLIHPDSVFVTHQKFVKKCKMFSAPWGRYRPYCGSVPSFPAVRPVCGLVLVEAVSAVNGPSLGRLERNFALCTAIGACCFEELSGPVPVVISVSAVCHDISLLVLVSQ